jgi:uncharacterized membrane protein
MDAVYIVLIAIILIIVLIVIFTFVTYLFLDIFRTPSARQAVKTMQKKDKEKQE